MTTRIGELRSAANHLKCAAQEIDPYKAFMAVCYAYDTFDTDNALPSDAISIIYEELHWKENRQGAAYLANALALVFLAEALLLEQDAARLHPNDHDFAWQEKRHDAELGSIVREWRGGVKRT